MREKVFTAENAAAAPRERDIAQANELPKLSPDPDGNNNRACAVRTIPKTGSDSKKQRKR